MTLQEAKNVAFKLGELQMKPVNMGELTEAIVVLSDFARHISFIMDKFNEGDD